MIDNRLLGHALYNARINAGYDGKQKTLSQFAEDMSAQLGRQLIVKTVNSYESGKTLPKFEIVVAWTKLCFPYWLDGMRKIYQASWKEDE